MIAEPKSSETKQAGELEAAILRRAEALAREQQEQARHSVERIQQECAERLRMREEREILLAKAAADRRFHRKAQASEIQLQAEMDRLRWELVENVMLALGERLKALVRDENEYLPLLHQLLRQAAHSIERQELIAEVNANDYQLLHGRWNSIVQMVAPDKRIQLKMALQPPASTCSGGVLVYSEDRRICVDNTLEGRVALLSDELHRVILGHLFPSNDSSMSLLFTG
jgi:V/A-type H+-transporting ATPase subunit E